MITLIMRQTSKYRWRLESPSGNVLQDNISVQDAHKAAAYAQCYVSSYNNWDYKLIPFQEEDSE